MVTTLSRRPNFLEPPNNSQPKCHQAGRQCNAVQSGPRAGKHAGIQARKLAHMLPPYTQMHVSAPLLGHSVCLRPREKMWTCTLNAIYSLNGKY